MSIKEDNRNTNQRAQSSFIKKLKTSLFDAPERRSRFFTFVSEDGLSKSYLTHFIIIVLAMSGWGYIKNKRAEKKSS